MSKFDGIKVGDRAELTHLLSQRDIDRFVELTGDDNRLHVDEAFARTTTFRKPVAHGMLGASFISTIIGTKLPGDGALWFAQSLEFLLPVRVGDEITVRAEVLQKHESSRTLELRTDIFNQNGQKVTTGSAKVRMVEAEIPIVTPEKSSLPRTALVIGGSGGIGTAACRRLAADGFHVAVHYHSAEEVARNLVASLQKDGKKAAAFRADIAREDQVKNLIEQVTRALGPVDVLVNCATAKVLSLKLDDLRWEHFEAHYQLQLRGQFLLMKYLLPGMYKKGAGKIIAITTQYIENAPPRDFLPYVAAKSALHGYCKGLASELAGKGITVNMVSPGITDTDLIADMPERARTLAAAKTPLKRLANADDIAGVIAFLASSAADYLTGETVRVNGGQVML